MASPALGLDFERTVAAPPLEVRRALTDALRELGYQVTAEQLTRVEAKRGSKWLGGSMMPLKTLPVIATFELRAEPSGCSVVAHLVDEHVNVLGKAWGQNQPYRAVFAEAQARVDAALARLDPTAAVSFAPPRFWSKGGDIALLEQANVATARASGAALDKANEMLEGGSKSQAPSAWKGVDSVSFAASTGTAVLSLAETQAHLGIAVMIASNPSSLPANLAREVEQFAARVEEGLTAAGGRAVTIEVGDAERPVLEFLHQQARIRDGLPVRTLHVCRTCHFQKITNEDYARVTTRNQRLRTLVSGVGATISSGGIQPFVVFGQLFKFRKLDPDYVCPRCQGLESDETLITFCPSCGDMRQEAALRQCRKCKYEFRSRLTPEPFWLSVEDAALAAAPANPVQAWVAPPGAGAPQAPPGWPPAPAGAAPVMPGTGAYAYPPPAGWSAPDQGAAPPAPAGAAPVMPGTGAYAYPPPAGWSAPDQGAAPPAGWAPGPAPVPPDPAAAITPPERPRPAIDGVASSTEAPVPPGGSARADSASAASGGPVSAAPTPADGTSAPELPPAGGAPATTEATPVVAAEPSVLVVEPPASAAASPGEPAAQPLPAAASAVPVASVPAAPPAVPVPAPPLPVAQPQAPAPGAMPGWPPPDKLGERYAIPQPPPAAVAAWPHPHQVPLGAPPIGPRRGKQCQLCRREFASLWRIVISTPNGFEERFVCGDPAGCALSSATPPVQV